MPKLTTRYLRTLKPRDREYKVADEKIPGFMARVRTSGHIYFGVQYRYKGGFRWLTLGRWGESRVAVTAAKARKDAEAAIGALRNGIDPAAKRDGDRESLTLTAFAEEYLERHASLKKKPRSAAEDKRLLKRLILPKLGRRRVVDLSRAEVDRFHAGLAATPYQANRALVLLSTMMNLAERWGMRPEYSNPCRLIERYKEAKRERFLSAAELGRLGEALSEAERLGTETPEALTAIRLLLFLGLRRSEVLGARWADVDFEGATLALADTKTGPRRVPLNAPALAVLTALPRSSEWLIPGREDGEALVNLDKPWRRIRAAAGLGKVRIHDLRHSFASAAVGGGETLYLVQALLGHTNSSTTERYSHLSDDPVRRASERTAAGLAAALENKPDAAVVPLRDRA
jgi:integrase